MALHTAPARHNLPLEPNSFIGRERDLSDLSRLLGSSRVITLCGVGGIGKTRLAIRMAARATTLFPDGVWLAELADISAQEHILTRVAAAVGVSRENGRTLADTLTDALRGRRLLLVLDNCEHVIDGVATVAKALLSSCPHVSLVITSREPARISGEVIWRVPPLPLPPGRDGLRALTRADPPTEATGAEAVQLFIERARAVAQDFWVTPERIGLISDICRMLDGIPLGIELAAARVRVLSLAQIAERLNDRFRFLAASHRNAPLRQQTLRAVIDWSHGLLAEPEQILLRRLSVFSGWDLESAEQVCADPGSPGTIGDRDILDLLSSLVDRSLVTLSGEYRGRARYRMLETIHDYATKRLGESGEEASYRDRHRERMLELAEQLARNARFGHGMAWSERFEVWQRVATEHDNLRSALRWSHESGATDHGLRLCVALRPYWLMTGQFVEGARWADLFLDKRSGDPLLRGRAMVCRAGLAFDCKDHRSAAQLGEEGLRRCRAAGDDRSVALALNILAMTDMRAKDHDRASARLAEAVELTRSIGDPWNEGIARGTQGALAARTGDPAAAHEHYGAALRILRRIDHRWGVGRTLIGQGMVSEAEGDLVSADRSYREALELQRTIGAPSELARCLAGVGRIAAYQGDLDQAYDYLSESLTLSHSTGQRMGVARGLAAIADVAARRGQFEMSHRLSGAATAIRRRAGLPPSKRPLSNEDVPPALRSRASHCWKEGERLELDEAVEIALRLSGERRGGECSEAPRTAVPGRGGRRPRPAQKTGVQPLTRREHEIATLIGEGLSNRAIARSLFISPATVARHVANINTKLGFNSRTQIAAWITRQAIHS